MAQTTVRELGAIDVLFNNAGIIKVHPFLEVEDEDFDRIMAVNAKGAFLWRAGGRPPHGRPGAAARSSNTASIAARVGVADVVPYAMSKAAVMSLTRFDVRFFACGPTGSP